MFLICSKSKEFIRRPGSRAALAREMKAAAEQPPTEFPSARF